MRYLSVCSGIEAVSVAWHPLGWKPLAFSEIEPFPRAVLQHHYPYVPLHGDFTELRHQDWIVDADILVGGTPCQAFSIAGLRQSLSDDRGNLSLEFIRLADAIDDLRRDAGRSEAFVLWENVPGVLSVQDNAFGTFLAGICGCDAPLVSPNEYGWSDAGVVAGPKRVAAWRVLDAQYFGLAQRRRRVFVLACGGSDRWRCADALLPIVKGMPGNSAPRRQTGEGIAQTIAARTRGGGGLGTDFDCDGGLIHFQGRGTNLEFGRDIAGTLSTSIDRASGSSPCVARCETSRNARIDAETETLIPVGVALRGRDEGGTAELTGDIMPALRTGGGGGDKPHVLAFSAKDHGADTLENLSPTLRAGGFVGSHANAGVMPAIAFRTTGNAGAYETGDCAPCLGTGTDPSHTTLLTGWRVRRLTPGECLKLQGFPPDYLDIHFRGRPAADGPKYKATGNSMATHVIRWIGQRIKSVAGDQMEAAA